ncbi:hypothetical protein BZG36_01832 [Bifiguratus adelaidae]|uniref:Alpha/beta hydrolase fold-3 domain-containing protein n=1 Tax=Bifiguratus adelaidae TaxID=1938954 RepID=A0A261Y2C9_9FUNG|nr:hypothetical protein BZG36_01832 [Bifiguratus adelaidae]
MQFFWDEYLNDESKEGDHPYVSPLFYPRLSKFPPTFIMPAGMDPLRDEGIVMAKQLSEAGIQTELVVDSGFPHWWFMFPLPSANKGIQRWADAIKSAFQ